MFAFLRAPLSAHRMQLGIITLLSVLMPAAAVLIPLFAGRAIDGSRGSIGLLIAAAFARFCTHGARRFFAGKLSVDVQHDIRMRCLAALQGASPAAMAQVRTGQVVSRTISDLNQIQGMLAMLPIMGSIFVEVVLILGIMFWLSWPLAVLLSIQLPVLAAIAFFSRRRLYDATWEAQQQAADVASQVEETVTGVRIVKAFVQEEREQTSFMARARRLFGMRLHVGQLTARFQPALAAVPQIALIATVVAGGLLAMRGAITIGEFLSASAYVTLLSRMTRMGAGMLVILHLANAAVSRVQDVLALPQRQAPANPGKLPNGPVGVRGTFRTRAGEDLAVDVTPGSTAYITGPAGSGKSALALALAGQSADVKADFEAYAGGTAVRLGDLPLTQWPTIVFDEPFLYSMSIAENIRMGTQASDAEVAEAARIACAADFIDELGGYSTIVGERGLTLSGGQRQRIALARAVLRNPRVLILDSATSAIDTVTEQKIIANLHQRAGEGNLTMVIVDHRAAPEDTGATNADAEKTGVISLPAPPARPLWPRSWEEIQESTNQELLGLADGTGDDEERARAADAARFTDMLEADAAALRRVTPSQQEPTSHNATPAGPESENTTPALRLRTLVGLVPVATAVIVATLLLGLVADIALPSLVRKAIDEGISRSDRSALFSLGLGALLLVCISWAASAWNTVLTTHTGERLLYALRVRSFEHLHRLPMSWFEQNASGRVMTRMTTDIDNLSSFLQTGLSQAIVSTTMLLGVLGMLIWTDPALAGITALFLPVIGVGAWVFRRYSSRLYRAARSQVSTVNAHFQEAVNGLNTAAAYGFGPVLSERIGEQSQQYVGLRTRAQAAVSIFFPGISFITELAQATVLFFGTARVAEGTTSHGALVAFSLYLTFFFGPVQQLSQIFDKFQQAAVSFERISELLAVPTEPSTGDDGADARLPGKVAAVDFSDVHFRYDGAEQDSLRGACLGFRGTTALVGATGAGKSTIAKLVTRWYQPSAGTITAVFDTDNPEVQRLDLQQLPLRAWRTRVGYVPQEAHLFRGTVAENIAYGRPTASQEEITAAIAAIGGRDIIAGIDGGFAGEVGERGRGLSSAQQQIIALARAELIDPDIMVLDEATANIDPAVEADVVRAIALATRSRVAIIIAHRLSTAELADNIAVVSAGKIVEQGRHQELLESSGRYADLVAASRESR
ncbi:ABC transporter ATP-binding protein [Corynebacterium urealyticum]|uniref:ABC transporter ATP-binding protein n=1 Tax=Corynebacterium urealyticum TaxID=43771 RepID=UPI00293EF4C1|nr:ABC transporter ATP-binding protein [Corynebacterium urealyticum]WOH95079.1 ABC transporter ATP-binding protein [Corynebacterium urealyticum]